jgi:glycolate oxidase FAD binding subunit
MLHPESEEEIAAAVREFRGTKTSIAIRGGGTRAGFGHRVQADAILSTIGLTGVTMYEPAEMVMSVRSGTSIREIEVSLAAKGQMLPFEALDHRPIFGTSGEPTIGGAVACNAAGPRRISAGGIRDSMLGLRFVNGIGHVIKSGGRVMKTVTGLDLVRLSCGAHGTLGVLTEVTFKVLPRPESAATILLEGLSDDRGVAALMAAMGSPMEVAGAAHIPAGRDRKLANTLLRLEGFEASVGRRLNDLQSFLADWGEAQTIEGDVSVQTWRAIRDAAFLPNDPEIALWRISVKPSDGPRLVPSLTCIPIVDHFYDWSGGLVWLAVQAGSAYASVVRLAVAGIGGHSTLIRAPESVKCSVPVFEPPSRALLRLTAGIKKSMDPERLFNRSLMYEGV